MRFWDSSAIVALVLTEPTTPFARGEHAADPQLVLWWATFVECASALERRARTGIEPPAVIDRGFTALQSHRRRWLEIGPDDRVRETAVSLLHQHELRAADALQLAAAWAACENRPAGFGFVCFDRRLAAAATADGFAVTGPS